MLVFGRWLVVLGFVAMAIALATLGATLAAAETVAVPQTASPTPVPMVPAAPSASAPAPTVLVPAAPGPALGSLAPGAVAPPAPAPSAPAPEAPAAAIGAAEQVRGFSCFTGGLFAAAGTWAFSEFVVAASAGGSAWPVTLPLMAAAFVTGCGVGSEALPAFYALFR